MVVQLKRLLATYFLSIRDNWPANWITWMRFISLWNSIRIARLLDNDEMLRDNWIGSMSLEMSILMIDSNLNTRHRILLHEIDTLWIQDHGQKINKHDTPSRNNPWILWVFHLKLNLLSLCLVIAVILLKVPCHNLTVSKCQILRIEMTKGSNYVIGIIIETCGSIIQLLSL